jgi:twitching motility protein PilU
MQTFDSALFDLVKKGMISEEEAIKNSDSPTDLTLKLKLDKGNFSQETDDSSKKISRLSLEPKGYDL